MVRRLALTAVAWPALRLVAALAVVSALAACPRSGGMECNVDAECDGEVCARDQFCHPVSEVREVRVTWTIRGMPATIASCGNTDLFINFLGGAQREALAYAPVPCATGQFSVDKLPRAYGSVELGVERGSSETQPLASDTVIFDIVP